MKPIVFPGNSLASIRDFRAPAKREKSIYVLHGFQKKAQRTSKRDVAAIRSALKELM